MKNSVVSVLSVLLLNATTALALECPKGSNLVEVNATLQFATSEQETCPFLIKDPTLINKIFPGTQFIYPDEAFPGMRGPLCISGTLQGGTIAINGEENPITDLSIESIQRLDPRAIALASELPDVRVLIPGIPGPIILAPGFFINTTETLSGSGITIVEVSWEDAEEESHDAELVLDDRFSISKTYFIDHEEFIPMAVSGEWKDIHGRLVGHGNVQSLFPIIVDSFSLTGKLCAK